MEQPLPLDLKQELMLQINQRLFDQRLLSRETYEEAKVRIVNGRTKEENRGAESWDERGRA